MIAFADHGMVAELLEPDFAHAESVIASIAEHGVDVELLAADLQDKGAKSFSDSWASLLAQVQSKAASLVAA